MRKDVYKKYALNFYEEDKELCQLLEERVKEDRITLRGFILIAIEEKLKKEEK